MKKATAYKRSNGWYFHAVSKTTAGVGMGTVPYIRLDSDASPNELVNALFSALEGSSCNLPHPHPTVAARSFLPMLELAGVKNWAEFCQGAANIGIELDDDVITLTPWRNAGARMGFVPITNARLKIAATEPWTEISATLQDAMEISARA